MTTEKQIENGLVGAWRSIRAEFAAIQIMVMKRSRMNDRRRTHPPITREEMEAALADGQALIDMIDG